MARDVTSATWSWERLAAYASPPALRRALDHLLLDQVDLHDAGPHLAGRVGIFDVGAARSDGRSLCSCLQDQPCAHAVALLASASGLSGKDAPAAAHQAPRLAFRPQDPPVPVAAFPESANDLEVPADALSERQRTAVESVAGIVRRSAASYALPRSEVPALAGALEALGTALVTFGRRPFVRLRATRRDGLIRLVSTETPGASTRGSLERHGFRPVRKPKSLVHEWEGPTSALHLVAEEIAHAANAVILAEPTPPSFEPMAPSATAASVPSATRRTPAMPVIMSRRRFEWWTPRESLVPLQLAILQRHSFGQHERGLLLSNEGARNAERELSAAGLHVVRVEDASPIQADASAALEADVALVRVRARPIPGPVGDALRRNGFSLKAQLSGETHYEGPAGNLPSLSLAFAQAGAHLLPGPDGWPPIPEAPPPAGPLFQDDPRLPIAREGVLRRAQDGRLGLDAHPAGGLLPRSVRLELYRMGYLSTEGSVNAPVSEAGRLVALLRDAGFDARWPRPTSTDWRLATVRYHERPRKEGGGTLLHLKGPIPLGRLGGVDPVAESARIHAMVASMEEALKARHPEARPLAVGVMPGVWTVAGGAGEFLLEAAARGAAVTPSGALTPSPMSRGVVLVDTACLPPRLMEFRRTVDEHGVLRPVVSPDIETVVRRVVSEGLEVDEERGHYLIPSPRMTELVEALREMGARVLQRRLAPRGKRYARWEPELPEDATGARPRLRSRWQGVPYDGEVPGLRETTELDPHQREGIAFILERGYCCLLADEMGLGKTLTSIATAQFLPGRVLVVCPASARGVWKQEVRAWTTEDVRVLNPTDPVERAAQGKEKYVVVAYSGLGKFSDELRKVNFDLVILDESHYVKSRKALRTKLVQEKLRGIPRRLILSGTPVMNEPQEVRTQLAFVHPDEWSDTAWFARRFQQPWRHGTSEVKEQVLARLRQYLEGVMLRREKRQALPDLPDKHLHVHRLPLSDAARASYDLQEDAFRDYVQENDETALTTGMIATSGHLEALKQNVLIGKLPRVLDDLRKMLDDGEKVVVFCHYREPIRAIAKELSPYGVVTLTGSTAPDERGAVVQRFQEDDQTRVFVGQTLAAGTAITLTAARHAVFTDLEWNPALHRQAMDRIHRKTQTRDVEVHFYIAEDTIDEDIAEVLEEKTQMMDQLLEGRTGSSFGLRDKDAVQREVALRILSRKRRTRATAEADEDD
ncbi:MAG TPA: DEAD/DEAH box helicase [Candidatus Thermoplasmatota archaeon]|nr:DEAD/DEAH box helicase [Candidatus Thermoplasmatota archaeon]